MKLRTAIIDDEPIALEKLRKYVEKVPFLELSGAYQSGTEAISDLLNNPVDLIVTDIRMPDLSGIDLINSLPSPPMIIFTTAYSEYAVESYRFSAVDYLLKPYSFADFQRAAGKAMERMKPSAPVSAAQPTSPEESIFVKVDYRFIRVDLKSIRYIKGYGEYLQLFVDSSPTPLVTLSSFSAISDKLSPNFLQVHRSYIVNMDRVALIMRNRITMDCETVISVGDSYKAALSSYLTDHSVGVNSRKIDPST
ncbi:MAG: response regulator transcription factor [Paramuribaculum sp.]|nr:response regulator transcription factor [Paramuribaculum sp.]MDE7450272.1 response regulator transcription factor [Paramuribaculum sp.]